MTTLTRNFTHNYVTWGIRAAQIVFTIINLGLIGNVIDKFFSNGSAGFNMFVVVLTLLYLISIFGLSFFKPEVLIIGIILVFESFLALLWFIGFIVWASDFGGLNCNYYTTINFVTYSYNTSSCHASKAVIAFGLFLFLLFTFSAIIIGIEVARPIIKTKPSSLWETNGTSGNLLNKQVFALLNIPATSGDIEQSNPSITEEKVVDEGAPTQNSNTTVIDDENYETTQPK